ncbi:MAG: hypothetical protein KDE54_25230 [Caldilineaceae bacterium]|nr:hypothetical protein [Caldilineaceae bacterium]MCB0141211.1 hypothetical protein [Caldilineaceae bacterium]MCB9156412.1 hypothetical protein [Caldilineaceae bacterium]
MRTFIQLMPGVLHRCATARQRLMPRRIGWQICRLLLLITALLPLTALPAQAHGGVVVAGDLTAKYEWLIQVSPYPVTTPGETFVSLVVYDIKTYQPINGLTVEAYLAPPGSTELCCQPGRDLGPIDILIDSEQYPGDYSILYDFTPVGQWSGLFIVKDEDGEWTAPFTFLVLPQSLEQFESPIVTPSFVLTSPLASGQSGAPAVNVQAGNGQADNGATDASASTGETTRPANAAPARGLAGLSMGYLLAIGGGALIPILLLFFWFLRSSNGEVDDGEDEEETAHD